MSSFLLVHGVQVHGVHVADEAGEGSVEPQVGHLVGRVGLHDGVLLNLQPDVADEAVAPGGNCIKIGLPGKLILGDFFQ